MPSYVFRSLESFIIPEHNGLNSAGAVLPSFPLPKFAHSLNNVQYAPSEAEILFGAQFCSFPFSQYTILLLLLGN